MADTTGNQRRETRRETVRERQLKALQLRRAGLDYERIAKEVGYANKSAAWKAVQKALEDSKRELADEVLELELQRLDEMSVLPYSAAIKGDVKAGHFVLKVMERRAKLLNLDNSQTTDQVREGVTLLAAISSQLLSAPDTYEPVTDDDAA